MASGGFTATTRLNVTNPNDGLTGVMHCKDARLMQATMQFLPEANTMEPRGRTKD